MVRRDMDDQGNPRPVRRQRFRALPLLTAGCAVVALFGLWVRSVRQPSLVWYVSPPLDRVGTRVRILYPRGWKPTLRYMAPFQLIQMRPEPLLPWLPRWARLGPFAPPSVWDAVHVDYNLNLIKQPEVGGAVPIGPILYPPGCAPPTPAEIKWLFRPHFEPSCGCYIEDKTQDCPRNSGAIHVQYDRIDGAAFWATHTAVCNSLRIE